MGLKRVKFCRMTREELEKYARHGPKMMSKLPYACELGERGQQIHELDQLGAGAARADSAAGIPDNQWNPQVLLEVALLAPHPMLPERPAVVRDHNDNRATGRPDLGEGVDHLQTDVSRCGRG